MCPPSDRRPWTSVTCRPATIPTHSTMYTLCPRPTPAPGRTPVRNTRMSGGGGLRPTYFCTPQLPFSRRPRPPCVTAPPELASPCLPGEGFSIPGQIRASRNCIPPHGTHLVGWGGGVRTGCASTVPSDAAVALPLEHRRTVGPCVSLATHSCHHAHRRGRLRLMLQSGRGPLLRPYRPRDTRSWAG